MVDWEWAMRCVLGSGLGGREGTEWWRCVHGRDAGEHGRFHALNLPLGTTGGKSFSAKIELNLSRFNSGT
jgi:hypothetical protein